MAFSAAERRRRYGRPCLTCGAQTDGSNGAAKAPYYCAQCTAAASVRWTPELILAAIQEYAEIMGRPPAAMDFHPSLARARGHFARAEMFSRHDWPSYVTVYTQFGSWNTAVETAGFVPNAPGHHIEETYPLGEVAA